MNYGGFNELPPTLRRPLAAQVQLQAVIAQQQQQRARTPSQVAVHFLSSAHTLLPDWSRRFSISIPAEEISPDWPEQLYLLV